MSLFQDQAERIANKALNNAKSRAAAGVNARLSAAQETLRKGVGAEAQRVASGLDAATGGLAERLTGTSLEGYAGQYAAGLVDTAANRLRGKVNRAIRNFGGRGFGGTPGTFWSTHSIIMGGVTPAEAKKIFDDVHGQVYARKNLWMIEVTSNLNYGEQNLPQLFNLFATEVSYSPCIMTGEAVKIGGANYDAVRGHEPSELSVTAYDDAQGTIKKWFAAHHHAASATDGTIAEPATYAIKIRIIHAAITDGTARNAFKVSGYFRPNNIECSLSRSDDGMEEVQMTFTQLDTFMRP